MEYCIQCGNELPNESKFCMKCGTPVEGEAYAPPEAKGNVFPPIAKAPDSQGQVSTAKKHFSAYKVFYGFAAAFFAVQLVPILLILEGQLAMADGVPGMVADVVSTCVPAFLAAFLMYKIIRLMEPKSDSSGQKRRMDANGVLVMAIVLLVIEGALVILSYYFIHFAPEFTDVNFVLSGVGKSMKLILPLSLLATLLLCAGNALSKKA